MDAPQWGVPPPLKNEAPPTEKQPPTIEKWSPLPGNDSKKNSKIPQERDFLTWSIQNL